MSDLSALNTLGLPSNATTLHRIESVDNLLAVWRDGQAQGWLPRLLGGGSNVLLAEQISTPLCLMRIRGIQAVPRPDGVHVRAAAGEDWHGLVRWTLGRGLSGLENLALIPGSVGAAPVQNIGAYGVELAERFVGAEVLNLATGELQRMGREEMAFGYRTSLMKGEPNGFAVLSVTLRLDRPTRTVSTGYPDIHTELSRLGRADSHNPLDVAEAVIRVRRRKLPDPRKIPNAGSFFKNPVISAEDFAGLTARLSTREGALQSYPDSAGVKLAAAQLIEACMNRDGKRPSWADVEAPVRVWERQPLVLTNPGRRPAADVLSVAEQIQDAVEARFGVRLQMEPDLIVD
jgi:UDP-N-acetylmuramate dehydrogenase